jgi:carbon storage regulator
MSREQIGVAMLVLTRKSQQSVVVASSVDLQELVRVTVVEVCGGRVKLGFQANDNLIIHREEVWERVCGEHDSSAAIQDAEPLRYPVPYID